MKKWQILAVLFGVLLVAAPLVASAEEAEDYDDESEEAAPAGDDSEKDVLVVTTKNWDSTVGSAKYALV
jgi:hypothetical protein